MSAPPDNEAGAAGARSLGAASSTWIDDELARLIELLAELERIALVPERGARPA